MGRIKHFMAAFVAVVFCVLSVPVMAQSGNITLYVNGIKVDTEEAPFIQNDRTMVPLKSLELLELGTYIDEMTGCIYVFDNIDKLIEMEPNKYMARVDSTIIDIDAPALIVNGTAFVPLRFVCENFDLKVKWDGKTQTVYVGKAAIIDYNGKTPIIGAPSATVKQAQAWAKKRGATDLFISLAPLYWELCSDSGVDPAVAYAQSAKETAFGRFTGVLDASFCNPCGLKTTQGGSDSDKNAHMRFPDWKTGITAQMDHLALYAGALGYPKADTPDPRHFATLFGKSPTVEELGGKWAPSADYGTSIVKDYLLDMRSTTVK